MNIVIREDIATVCNCIGCIENFIGDICGCVLLLNAHVFVIAGDAAGLCLADLEPSLMTLYVEVFIYIYDLFIKGIDIAWGCLILSFHADKQLRFISDLTELVVALSNNTRMWFLRGHTPVEMSEIVVSDTVHL